MSTPELKEKIKDHEAYPRMDGTSSYQSYLVVARDKENNAQLGIKPLYSIGQNQEGKTMTFLAFRLRVAPMEAQDNVAEIGSSDTTEKVKDIDEVFPFEWEKHPAGPAHLHNSRYRCSLIRSLGLNRGPHDIRQVKMDAEKLRFIGKTMNFILSQVPAEKMTVTDEELGAYLLGELDEFIAAVAGAAGDPKAALEHLEHQKQGFSKHYEEEKAKLEAAIAEQGKDGEEEYHPKAHFAADLGDMESVVGSMLKGAKPDLSVVEDDEAEIAVSDGPTAA